MQRRKVSHSVLGWSALLFSAVALYSVVCNPASAQRNWVASVDYDEELTFYRPRISLAQDGTSAVAWETYRKLTDGEAWHIAVQKFTVEGTPIGETTLLGDDRGCGKQEGLEPVGVQNADIEFDKKGFLFIAMEPVMRGFDGGEEKETSISVSSISPSGEVERDELTLPCTRKSARSMNFIEKERPRIDIGNDSDMALVVGSVAGEVATMSLKEKEKKTPFQMVSGVEPRMVRRVDARLAHTNESNFPVSFVATDIGGVQEHYDAWHDIATNGAKKALSWHRCPLLSGLRDSEECDIMVEFSGYGGLQSLYNRGPVKVNNGDAVGVLNYRPAITMNRRGESAVVWVDYRHGKHGEVYLQRYDERGNPDGGNLLVSRGQEFANEDAMVDDLDGIGPEVAMLDNGRIMVVWTESTASSMQAFGRYISEAGVVEGDPFLLDDRGVESGLADVASNGTHFGYTWLAKEDNGEAIFYNVPNVANTTYRSLPDNKEDLLLNGYPNPFSDKTTIHYVLLQEGHVKLSIYDLVGREISQLLDEWQEPGEYAIEVSGDTIEEGYYFVRLKQGVHEYTHTLIRSR